MFLSLFIIFLVIFLISAYLSYGRFLANRVFQLSDDHPTPAITFEDGADYVPTPKLSLISQHFSAIAAAGPIAGPILACQQFGWLPCILWICFGVILIGAVHDFGSLSMSVKHEAKTTAEMMKIYFGSKAGMAMLSFIWLSLIYIIIAFTEITASSFITRPEEMIGLDLQFNPGGAVAASAVFYLTLSLILGLLKRYTTIPHKILDPIFVILGFLVSIPGIYFSSAFVFSLQFWVWAILIYCAIASLCPMWLIMQPRGLMGGFVLYTAIGIAILGLLIGQYEIQWPMFKGFQIGLTSGSLFPFLFVTIACGACSGFHGLVCSGTTSKQLSCESHAHPVGYGAMCAEALVAILAVAIVMIMTPDQIQGLKPGTIYGRGIGEFLSLLVGKEYLSWCICFGALAFSTFVFDTLDVATRLGRYILEEVFALKSIWAKLLATIVTLAPPAFFLTTNTQGSWQGFWTLFGAANQLLASLSLMLISYWLFSLKRSFLFTLIPACLILIVTLTALSITAYQNLINYQQQFQLIPLFNAIIAITLILLAIVLFYIAFQKWNTHVEDGHGKNIF
jgi:carbon starvation protein